MVLTPCKKLLKEKCSNFNTAKHLIYLINQLNISQDIRSFLKGLGKQHEVDQPSVQFTSVIKTIQSISIEE